MKIVRKIPEHFIYLFETDGGSNPLKEFLYFTKYLGKKGVIDFSLADGQDSIHLQSSLKDNFILDSVPTSLIKNKEDNFRFRLTEIKNQQINTLVEILEPIERKASEYTEELITLGSIVKSLLSESEYIFLINPERITNEETFDIVKSCLRFEVEHNKRKVFLKTKKSEKWLDLVTDIVSKDDQKNFIINKNELSTLSDSDLIVDLPGKFSLVEKAS